MFITPIIVVSDLKLDIVDIYYSYWLESVQGTNMTSALTKISFCRYVMF